MAATVGLYQSLSPAPAPKTPHQDKTPAFVETNEAEAQWLALVAKSFGPEVFEAYANERAIFKKNRQDLLKARSKTYRFIQERNKVVTIDKLAFENLSALINQEETEHRMKLELIFRDRFQEARTLYAEFKESSPNSGDEIDNGLE